jgi:ribosomal-protein-alanine N-acetyltransferase
MRIIQAGLAHAQALAAMHGLVFPDDAWDAEAFAELLELPGMLALIDEHGGFLLLRTVLDEAEVITLGVIHPRRGIATHLLQAALERTGAVQIHLEVAENNAPALALYARFGFTRTGRRKAYYHDGTDALTLTLTRP